MVEKNNNTKVYGYSVLSKILLVLISIITSSLITRSLGVSNKGEYSYINNIANILVIIFSFGIGQVYSTFKRKNDKNYLNVFVLLLIIHAIAILAFAISAYCFKFNYYIYMALLLTFGGVIRNNIVYIASIEDIKKRNTVNLISKVIYTLLITVVYILKIHDLNVILLLLLFDEMVLSGIIYFTYGFKIKFHALKEFGKENYKELYKLGMFSMLSLLLTSLNYNIDTLILKSMSTSYSIGLYSVGVTLANMLWIIPDAFKDVLFYKTAKSDNINEIVKSTKFNLYLSLIIIVGFIILGKWFITILYGIEFVESYVVSIILLFGSVCMIIHKMISPLYISKGKQKRLLGIFAVSVLVNVILNIIFIPKFDIIGAAVSSVFSYTVAGGIILVMFAKEYNVKLKEFFVLKKSDFEIFKLIYSKLKR